MATVHKKSACVELLGVKWEIICVVPDTQLGVPGGDHCASWCIPRPGPARENEAGSVILDLNSQKPPV